MNFNTQRLNIYVQYVWIAASRFISSVILPFQAHNAFQRENAELRFRIFDSIKTMLI